ncbi:MAG: hypothetical protein ACREDH_12225 [Methylocella sp.]
MPESLGATVFDWLNPGTVAAEYAAVGKEPPPDTSIMDVAQAAKTDAIAAAQAGADALTEGTRKIVYAAAIGLGLYIAWKIFGGSR